MTETRRPDPCHYDRALAQRVTRAHRDDCPKGRDCPGERGCAPAPHPTARYADAPTPPTPPRRRVRNAKGRSPTTSARSARRTIHTVPGANPSIPGLIEPIDPGDAGEFSTPGSGYTRLIDPTETEVLLLLARMVLCGLVPLVAASAARAMIEENAVSVELGLGLSLVDVGVEP